MDKHNQENAKFVTHMVVCWVAAVLLTVFGCLISQEWKRHFKVRNAQSSLAAEVILSQIKIEHAKGIAESNKIIGKSLKNNELYLKYMETKSLWHTKNKVIYFPTDKNMPMLEYCKKEEK
jgi:hypothetical protein